MRVSGKTVQIYENMAWICSRVGINVSPDVALTIRDESKAQFHLLELNKVISVVGRLHEVRFAEVDLRDCELVA